MYKYLIKSIDSYCTISAILNISEYRQFNKGALAKGLLIVGTTATIAGNYNSLKSAVPNIIKDGKTVVDKFKNFKIK